MDRDLWTKIQDEIKLRVDAEPTLGSFLYSLVLSKKDLLGAVSSILASKLHSDALSAMDIKKFIIDVYRDCKGIEEDLEADIKFFKDHDPACNYFSTPLLFYKGFLGLATYRAAHCLWNNDRHTMALFFQNRASEVFGVDIHPAATIDSPVMIDHATGVVIGETAKIKKTACPNSFWHFLRTSDPELQIKMIMFVLIPKASFSKRNHLTFYTNKKRIQ